MAFILGCSENSRHVGVWGRAPMGPGAEPLVRRCGGQSSQKLKAFCCKSSKFLYFMEGIVERQQGAKQPTANTKYI